MTTRANDALIRMHALNSGWRYLQKPEAQAAFGRRIGAPRIALLKASLKVELDALASVIIQELPLASDSDLMVGTIPALPGSAPLIGPDVAETAQRLRTAMPTVAQDAEDE